MNSKSIKYWKNYQKGITGKLNITYLRTNEILVFFSFPYKTLKV